MSEKKKKVNLNSWKNRNFIVFYGKSYYKFENNSDDDFCDLTFDSNSLLAKSILDLDINEYKNYGLVSLSKDHSQLVTWNSLCIFGDKKFLKKYVWWFLPPVFLFGWIVVIAKYKKIKNKVCEGFFSVHNELLLDKYKLQGDLGGEEEILEAKRLFAENKSFKQISDKLDNYSKFSELIENLDDAQYQKLRDLRNEYSDFYEIEEILRDPRLELPVSEDHLGTLKKIYVDNDSDIYQIQEKLNNYNIVSNDLTQLKNSLGGEEEILEAKRLFAENNSFRNVSEKISDPRLKFSVSDANQLAVLDDLYEKNNRNVVDIQNKIYNYDDVSNKLSQLTEDLGGDAGIYKVKQLLNEHEDIDSISKKLSDPKLGLSIKNEHLDSMMSIYQENNEDPVQIVKKIGDYDLIKGKFDSLKQDLGDDMGILEAKKLLEKHMNFDNISAKLNNYSKFSELIETLDDAQYQKLRDLRNEYSDFYEIEEILRDPRLDLPVSKDHIGTLEKIYTENNNDIYQIQEKIKNYYDVSDKLSQLTEDLGGGEEVHAVKALIKKYGGANEINKLLSNPKLNLDIEDNHLNYLMDIYRNYDRDVSKIQSALKFANELIDFDNYGCSNEVEVRNKLSNSLSKDQQKVLEEYGKMNNLESIDVQKVCEYIQEEVTKQLNDQKEKYGLLEDVSSRAKNYEAYICDLIEDTYSGDVYCTVTRQYHINNLGSNDKTGKIDCLVESKDPNSPISVKMVIDVKYVDNPDKSIDKWGKELWEKQIRNYSQQVNSPINLIVTNRYVSKNNFWKYKEIDENKLFFVIHDSILVSFMSSISLIFHLCHSNSSMMAEKLSRLKNAIPSILDLDTVHSISKVFDIYSASDDKLTEKFEGLIKGIQNEIKRRKQKLEAVKLEKIKQKVKDYTEIQEEKKLLENSQDVEIVDNTEEKED